MKDITTVLDPHIGDQMNCPGCDCLLELTPMDGWCGPHITCVGLTAHTDWIITVFSNPGQVNPRSKKH